MQETKANLKLSRPIELHKSQRLVSNDGQEITRLKRAIWPSHQTDDALHTAIRWHNSTLAITWQAILFLGSHATPPI